MRLAAAALAILIAAAARAGAAPGRVPVDPNVAPWNAVAKVQTNIGTRCTGVLVASSVVLTAAHCLYNPRTRALLLPVSLHVLFGFERDRYRVHRLVARYELGPDFVPGSPRAQPGDWARLTLAKSVPTAPLSLYAGPPRAGMAVVLAGYNRDRSQLLLADPDCHVKAVMPAAGGAQYLVHDCPATFGTSGAPLLSWQNGKWALIGINLAAGRDANLALIPAGLEPGPRIPAPAAGLTKAAFRLSAGAAPAIGHHRGR